LSPRRQYWWTTQQAVLQGLLEGESVREMVRRVCPQRRTVGRWLEGRSEEFELHLHSRFPDLGRAVDWKAFWSCCFERMSLGEAMGWLDRSGVVVP
jgi:hypothetical protein